MFKVVGPLDPEKDHFVGRAQELAQMREWVKSAETYGLVLGASQTGKTSLLLKLQADLQPQYTCVYLNFQSFSDLDQRQEVYQRLSEEIVAQLHGRLEKEEWPPVDYGLAFIHFLKQLSENMPSSRRIVLLLDEMDVLSQESLVSLANTIRGIFHQKMEKRELQKFVFIYAARTDVLTLAESQGSPLRNVTDCLYLEDFSLSETKQVLKYGFEDSQIVEAMANHIYDWTHGHPYLTQALGNGLVEMKQKQKDDFHPTKTSVDKAVQRLHEKGDSNLRHIVNALERAKRESPALLEKIQDILESRVKIRFSRTDPEILRLELMGIVREGEDGYCMIRNQIYRQILQNVREKEVQAAPKERLVPTPSTIGIVKRLVAKFNRKALAVLLLSLLSLCWLIPDFSDWVQAEALGKVNETPIVGLYNSKGEEIQATIYSPRLLSMNVPGTIQIVSHDPEKPDINVIPQPNSGIVPTRDKNDPTKFTIECKDASPGFVPINWTKYRQIDIVATMPRTGSLPVTATISVKTNYVFSLVTKLVAFVISSVIVVILALVPDKIKDVVTLLSAK